MHGTGLFEEGGQGFTSPQKLRERERQDAINRIRQADEDRRAARLATIRAMRDGLPDDSDDDE